jgi:hypothetical protein
MLDKAATAFILALIGLVLGSSRLMFSPAGATCRGAILTASIKVSALLRLGARQYR